MKETLYDPHFYLCSEKMPFTIRLEVTLTEEIDGRMLTDAVNEAIRRYPYFAVEIVEEDSEWLVVPNNRPLVTFAGDKSLLLGSDETNRHLAAFSYYGRTVAMHVSHVITDGAGCFPLLKTVLYGYLCRRTGMRLDPTDIRLPDDPLLPDEVGDPFPHEAVAAAEPFYTPPEKEFFRFTDGGYVNDDEWTVYRVELDEKAFMAFNVSHDGSPCALISSILAKAIRDVHPDETRDVVGSVSFNLRPALHNSASYRMLCHYIPVRYPSALRKERLSKLCTCTRGAITLLSQPENALFCVREQHELLRHVLALPTVRQKSDILAPAALADATNNTFSVSYVGKLPFGSLEPYITRLHALTDGSLYRSIFLELISINGKFCVSFMQGFSSDVYYRAFLERLKHYELPFVEREKTPLRTAKILLP